MGITSQDWYDAQCCILGTALLDPEQVPVVVSELRPEDFYGMPRKIFEAMVSLFRESSQNADVDVVAILRHLGDSKELRDAIMVLMQRAVSASQLPRYLATVRETAKLSRMKELGQSLSEASTYGEAASIADQIGTNLMERQGLTAYGPDDMIDRFEHNLTEQVDHLEWPFQGMNDEVFVSPGNYVIIMAEPSGGKTCLALQLMLLWSQKKRVLFLSQETDVDELFLRQAAYMAGISFKALIQRRLSPAELSAVRAQYKAFRSRNLKIIPTEGLTVAEIKAAAVQHRAEIVIVDYLQICKGAGTTRAEVVGTISGDLQAMAKSTKAVVVALSQVTIRDPSLRGKPLGMHSARESGNIEQNADLMIALDMTIDEGIKADRMLRVCKNKKGEQIRMALSFQGRYQRFEKINIPSAELNRLRAAGRAKRGKGTAVMNRGMETYTTEDFE